MAITCPQCTHTNPAGAKYCFFDGYSLSSAAQEGPVDPGSRPFPHPFVFPSGGQCENFDQLALGCQKDWDSARELLQSGAFDSFLGGMGRADLAMAAKEAVKFPDLDRGLDQFISRLPSQAVPAPRLQIEPVEIRLDSQPVGKDGGFIVKMHNMGARLLYGSVVVRLRLAATGRTDRRGPQADPVHQRWPAEGRRARPASAGRGEHARRQADLRDQRRQRRGRSSSIDVPVVPFSEGVLAGSIVAAATGGKSSQGRQGRRPAVRERQRGRVVQEATAGRIQCPALSHRAWGRCSSSSKPWA